MALAQKSAWLEQVFQDGQSDHASETVTGKWKRLIQVAMAYIQASGMGNGLLVPLDAVVAIRVHASRTQDLSVQVARARPAIKHFAAVPQCIDCLKMSPPIGFAHGALVESLEVTLHVGSP